MPDALSGILVSTAVKIVVALIPTTIIAAWLRKNWPTAFVYSLVTFTCLLYLFEYVGWTPSTESRVQDWLTKSGFSVQKESPAPSGYDFYFSVIDRDGYKTVVFRKTNVERVTFESYVTFLPGLREQLQKQQRQFRNGLELEFIRYGIGFTTAFEPGYIGMRFNDSALVTRSLSELEFLRHLHFVRAGSRLALLFTREYFDKTMPEVREAPRPAR